jgi:hypothetical protein
MSGSSRFPPAETRIERVHHTGASPLFEETHGALAAIAILEDLRDTLARVVTSQLQCESVAISD